MSAKGCPLCFSKDVLVEIFRNVRGRLDNTEGCIVVRAKTDPDKNIRSSLTFTKVASGSSIVLPDFVLVRLSRQK